MDFKGQRLAELILSRLLFLFGIVSFVVGYYQQDFMQMVYINGVGLALACLITLPGETEQVCSASSLLHAKTVKNCFMRCRLAMVQ